MQHRPGKGLGAVGYGHQQISYPSQPHGGLGIHLIIVDQISAIPMLMDWDILEDPNAHSMVNPMVALE